MGFALFFLGEYSNIILMSSFYVLLFFGGWFYSAFPFLVVFVIFIFIWARAAYPRFRYDQLMRLGWKIFIPFTFAWFFITSVFIFI
jgi:NADH-quinone oxidoreductase subunit H